MATVVLLLLVAGPWLVPIAVLWSRAADRDHVPPSLADAARRRLWST